MVAMGTTNPHQIGIYLTKSENKMARKMTARCNSDGTRERWGEVDRQH